MKFDVSLLVHDLGQMPALARFADDLGFDGIWTFETAHDWRTDARGDGRWIVRPGLLWMIPPRFTFGSTGRWLLGGAVQFTRGPDGSDVRVSAKVRGNFDFLRLIGGRRSPEKPSGAK